MRIIPKVPEKHEIASNSIKQTHQYQTTTTTNNTNTNNNTNNNSNNNNNTNSSQYDNHQQMKYSNKTLSNNTKNVNKTTIETVNTKKCIETETTLIRSEKRSIELTEEANDEEYGTDNSSYTDDSDTSVYNLSCDSTYANNFSKSPTFNFSKVDNSDGPLISSGHKVESARVSGGQKVDENEDQLKKLKSSKKGRKSRLSICIAQTRYKIVGRVAKSLGWRLVRYAGHWNILWVDSDPGIEIYKEMKRYQKINHFPGMQEICRKDLLARNLGRLLKMYPNEYDFYPKTWCFPADYMEAINFNKEHKNKTFILKPDAGAQGRGIFLTKNIKDSVKPTERLICQVYVSRPLLIDGFKFDLRVYTLITTVDPLRIFVYNEGLVRMATSKYKDPNEYNISDLFMHLTNYSVNKRNDNFSHDAKLGSKRKFSSLHRNLAKEGYDIDTLWRNIDDTIIKTILSSWPMLKHNYRACFPCHDVMQACFEILGFDILVDRNLKPYILEVNQSPSFYTDESVDYEVKEALIKDTLNLLNISLIDKAKIMNEDKKRIKMRLLMTRERTKLKTVYSKTNSNTISPLGQQIAWEESHLGGFRRIMPVHVDTHRYSHLIQLQNQASIYSDTAASKRREEAGKQMRIAILEKQKRNQSILLTSKTLRRKIGPPFKRRKEYCPLKKEWSGGCIISDLEERERRKLLGERSEMLKQNGVLKVILENFHKMKILSDSDRTKYGEHIKCIEQQQERDQHRLNMQNVACFSATVNDFTVKNILKNKINKTDPYDDKYLSLPLVTLDSQTSKSHLNTKVCKNISNNEVQTNNQNKNNSNKKVIKSEHQNRYFIDYAEENFREMIHDILQMKICKYYHTVNEIHQYL